MVGQQHRLGPLEMCVAGEIDVAGLLGTEDQHLLQGDDLGGHRQQLPLGVQPQIGGDLVVATAAGVQFGADIAGDLGHPALDRGVDVLVAGLEPELPRIELCPHLVEGAEQRGHLVLTQQASPSKAPDVGPRTGQVVMRQLPVVVEADGIVHDHVCGTAAQAAVPQSHRSGPATAASPPWRLSCTADHVATPRPHSRTKPSASSWRKVSVLS